MFIHKKSPFHLPSGALTDEHDWQAFQQRRRFLKQLQAGGAAIVGGALLPRTARANGENPNTAGRGRELPLAESYRDLLRRPGFPAERNPSYRARRPLTDEAIAGEYNNFYEFTTNKLAVWKEAASFQPRPWAIEVRGAVHRPMTLDVDDLAKLGYEERRYRFRCVEAWAMAVPWTGVPLRRFLEHVRPLGNAKYVRFVSFHRPAEARGQREDTHWPWPYYEGLTLAEASHPLALLVTGIYGHALPRQHGAPVRLMCPWKYGYKNIKSIVRVEFMTKRPRTFWHDLQPAEYDFDANVNPKAHHPRWSQARERMIGTGAVHDTAWLNGYAAQLGDLYPKQPIKPGWDTVRPPFDLRGR
jgi:sulfoxide reductase catalytic subunit YedY